MSKVSQNHRIALLPGILVNQIAAGEVIERPASVIKELVENSIDAGATRIDIDIESGGTKSIIIRDNGKGIHPEDMQLAILRHATSKLRSREDLEAILSLGFRGEALSSIASVAEFCLTSRIASEEHAYRLRVNSIHTSTGLEPAAHPVGTTVEVRNLFQNVPARRKFLRSDQTEFLHIFDTVKSLVMSRFDININLRHNSKSVLICPEVESDFRARIQSVMGSSFYRNARPVDAEAGPMQLHGWLGDVNCARSQSDRQYLFLNQRIIRDRQITHAIRMALEPDFPPSRYPAYILHLQMDPALVDVNVHPTKQEVRFRQSRDIHDFVFAALRQPDGVSLAYEEDSQLRAETGQPLFSSAHSTTSMASRLREAAATYIIPVNQKSSPDTLSSPLGMPVAILQGGYVLTTSAGELRILDFNRMKSEYLYHCLQQDFNQKNIRQRPLLVPVMFSFTERELQMLSSNLDLLTECGMQIELSGPRTVVIRSLPALLPDLDFKPLLDDMITAGQGKTFDAGTLLRLLVSYSGQAKPETSTLQQVGEQLRQIAGSDIPIKDRNCTGLWRTVSIPELQSWLNDKI